MRRRQGGLNAAIAAEIPHLRRFARALLHDVDSADDLVQDCVERALRKGHLWCARGPLRSWLFGIQYNLYRDRVRGRGADAAMAAARPVDDLGALECGQPASQEAHVECLDVVAALQRLPSDQRAALTLVALEDMDYAEAAEVLGISAGGLRTRLFRGRAALRTMLNGRRSAETRRRIG
jgi:RNA polymerase sigma-70 factor, ECF subfamily